MYLGPGSILVTAELEHPHSMIPTKQNLVGRWTSLNPEQGLPTE